MTQHVMQIKLEGLISVLAEHLYADTNVFVREMIQNAHDAVIKRKILKAEQDGVPKPDIHININTEERTIAFCDNGAGLTVDEIHNYLSTIGSSDKGDLKKRVEELRGADHARALQLIGQFGIGLLSGFIVSTKIEVLTKAANNPAFLWRSIGDTNYSVEPAERADVGTTVTLYLKPEHSRYLDPQELSKLVRMYADIIEIPIYVNDGLMPVNSIHAPWHLPYPTTEKRLQSYREYWQERFQNDTALEVIAVDEPFEYRDAASGSTKQGRVQGILGITNRRIPGVDTGGTVDLFISRMFIASRVRAVLPTWASFIQGAIECDALMPNAARDNIIPNDALEEARKKLGSRIIQWLTEMAFHHPKRFTEIMLWHSFHILAMCVRPEQGDFFRAIADIVPLQGDAGPITIQDYLTNAIALPNGRHLIYYIVEEASANQFYMLCKARNLHVLNAADGFTEEFIRRYAATWPERVELRRLDIESPEIFEIVPETEREIFGKMEAQYNSILPCKTKVSRFKPKEVPLLITNTSGSATQDEIGAIAANPAMPEYLRDILSQFLHEKREPVTLHLNADNPMIQRLACRSQLNDDVARNAMLSLYNNAVMLHARNITPDNIRTMFEQYNRVIDLLLSKAEELDSLQRKYLAAEAQLVTADATGMTRFVTCFVAMPFEDAQLNAVYAALEEVLEGAPFLWNVTRADDRVDHARLWKNVEKNMASAHCFIAEITDQRPNVMIEIGRMEAFNRPVLLMKRRGSPPPPADLRERLYIEYEGEGDALIQCLREQLSKQSNFCAQKGEKYLSATVLKSTGLLQEGICHRLAQEYETCSDFLTADPHRIANKMGVGNKSVFQGVQDSLRELVDRL